MELAKINEIRDVEKLLRQAEFKELPFKDKKKIRGNILKYINQKNRKK